MEEKLQILWDLLYSKVLDINCQILYEDGRWGYMIDGDVNIGWETLEDLEDVIEEL